MLSMTPNAFVSGDLKQCALGKRSQFLDLGIHPPIPRLLTQKKLTALVIKLSNIARRANQANLAHLG